ncbi:AraC family transcriptional regulator ligand-binding domain-containing protein [Alisedimentitalea sp. MJ-SS2]|uniref:AraC family transcriptional regulator ligand-binding domain-containing protein n=1 Tax=Aliisedimentitalea sp. MJ-SS2 TaxID=3049795 RepID=UPI0029086ACC|nr:AraC family transcriptional regulator ligand-binding domain-containing protein [Alisedimentitalea sp. MJ-SS2]MDU8929905.1 AraC family transcriptional regulator ligand-binding domain-containing protein [Alisedimentitalea sp. MJ-SS2]
MAKQETYSIGAQMIQMAQAMGLDHTRIMRRAGLAPDHFLSEDGGVTAEQFFALWQATEDEASGPGLALQIAKTAACGPMIPAIYGFASSPDIKTGFDRLAVFKPLVVPITMTAERDERGLTLRWAPPPDIRAPALFSLFELVYFVEICRSFTGHAIVPLALGGPLNPSIPPEVIEFFGVTPHLAPVPEMRLSHEDADRRMIFANEEQYRVIEADLRQQMHDRNKRLAVSIRVRRALVDILPAGEATIDAVCDRLAMSRRSLQRKLKEEGESFQSVLESTRAELSMHYLKRDDMSVHEISYLLAYRDPNSFYRAFQGWTGMTPGEARASLS